ncbi:MAG: hypothetical protein KKD44_05675 [Proteobacteria bacterium]|nr:hypothetical protein [Pseudomonadota bacterium]
MAQIIKFRHQTDRRSKQSENDLTGFLRRAVSLRKQEPEEGDFIHISGLKKMKLFFESKISDILIKNSFIDTGFFLCGTYISDLLTSITNKVPESWFAVDYVLKSYETGSPYLMKQGANICFLICSVFKERSEIRVMRYEDYEKMGIGLFSRFYSQTGAEIGYHMSRQYKIMVDVTGECMKTL